ncbi:MAG: acyl-CoA dehydrogenase family protein, partial [Dehalococcoidia bacterium]|nr:acyl-CoA dehydrogenase family protein [Dehalococcoidia bacterium]
MDFQFRPEDLAFRRQVRAYLAAMMTPEFELEIERRHDERGFLQGISRNLASQGWLTLAWPKEYGGGGASHVTQALLNEELGYFHVPDLAHIVGVNLVAPALMIHGTEEQKRKFLPRCARGEISAFALTEPDVGSDPARMRTTYERTADGRHFKIDGVKLWCTNGTIADLLVVMAAE